MQQQSGFDYVVQTSPPSPWVPVNAPLEQHHNVSELFKLFVGFFPMLFKTH
jgi:hypothetical protein